LSDELRGLIGETSRRATTCESTASLLQQHLLATLLCQEKSTVTNLICASGRQDADWSADYRLYSRDRVDPEQIFQKVLDEAEERIPADQPLVFALDDSIKEKSGFKIDGVKYRRDPLSPAFQTNLVPAQRFLQFSVAFPFEDGEARLVPVSFTHAPSAGKPPRQADEQALKLHREKEKQMKLNRWAIEQMRLLRKKTAAARRLIFTGDGSYTNKEVLRESLENSVYIGRVRKDMALHYPPETMPATGRRPSYGDKAPTPEELRKDSTVPWQNVEAFAAGKKHTFQVKRMGPVLWRKAGAKVFLQVLVISPLAYRLRKGAKLLYRQPAYIVCTDPEMPIEELLQYYLWRWGIEVNFREEKTLIGAGEAQVRTPASNRNLPAAIVGAYALLWLAALRLLPTGRCPQMRPPKWRRRGEDDRGIPSTGDLLRALRYQIWGDQLQDSSFSAVVTGQQPDTKPKKPGPSLAGALFDAA
jgi:hypothetical protein